MSEKLISFSIFGALILGYPLGVILTKFAAEHRLLARLCALAGVGMIFIGLMGGGGVRYLILAEAGLYLQVIFLVASFRFKRTFRAQHQELWASRRTADRSSTSPAAGHGATQA